MWQHILELIVEDLYPTFIIRYVNTKNYKWYFTIRPVRIEYLLHEWYSNLFQVITPSKEFITQLYFKNDVPPSYEDYIVNRATQFPSSDVRTSSGRNINFNLVIDVWSIGQQPYWKQLSMIICKDVYIVMRLNIFSYLKLQLIWTKYAHNRDDLFSWSYMHYIYTFLEALFFCHFAFWV